MKVVQLTPSRVLEPSTLDFFGYEIGPYVGCEHRCLYCYTQNEPEIDWDHEVGVLPEIGPKLAKELDEIEPQVIFIGRDTDPYQPIEAEYRHTRTALEEMLKRGFSASILTKSDLVIRDLELLKKVELMEEHI